jgi:hypothetical protein
VYVKLSTVAAAGASYVHQKPDEQSMVPPDVGAVDETTVGRAASPSTSLSST